MGQRINIISGVLLLLLAQACRQESSTGFNHQGGINDVKRNASQTSQGGGGHTFRNPVLHSDYSDPDVIRVGKEYFMTASSFNCVPALPLLRSRDLVHWQLTGYALKRLIPDDVYSRPKHGCGVWAPCIRFHKGEFYIYYPDPDYGIYLVKARSFDGPWSEPVIVKEGKGLIDPSPLWVDDGNAYLVYALAGSRAGVKSVLLVSRLSADGTKASDDAVMVFDGHDANPTVEGPKFYKRNGYYYIFAPAGGVRNGWQLVLRSENIFGPYISRVVMHQGATTVNGPHQGAWVTTPGGDDWFIHFQDKDAYGRIVHLQPLRWVDDWPVIGTDPDGDGTGEPVATGTIRGAERKNDFGSLNSDDEFNGTDIDLRWQWHANPSLTWGYMSGEMGFCRLNCIPEPEGHINLWDVPNLMLTKFPAEEFTATACLKFSGRHDGEKAGMVVMGRCYQYLSIIRYEGKYRIETVRCIDADKGMPEEIIDVQEYSADKVYMQIRVEKEAKCTFSYSADGETFIKTGDVFTAVPGMWIGAKTGFFALGGGPVNDCGSLDIEWFRISENNRDDESW